MCAKDKKSRTRNTPTRNYVDEDRKIPFCPECHSYPCSCDDNI